MATVEGRCKFYGINSRLPTGQALERNMVLRIGWTTNGDPVPKMEKWGCA